MKFFIDTANLDQIREAQDLGVLDGVTTNPSLMAKEGIVGQENILQHYRDICNLVDDKVSAEVIATDFEGMVKEGEILAALDDKIVVKIPMIRDGIKALKYFSDKGIRTNCTLIFSSGQALIAAKAGATYVSPFIGRIDEHRIYCRYASSHFIRYKKLYDCPTNNHAYSIKKPRGQQGKKAEPEIM